MRLRRQWSTCQHAQERVLGLPSVNPPPLNQPLQLRSVLIIDLAGHVVFTKQFNDEIQLNEEHAWGTGMSEA
jgi:hypothetical protein